MTVRKVLLAASAAALTASPAWALPGRAPSNDGTGHAPSTTPVGPPASPGAPGGDGSQAGGGSRSDRSGRSRRCTPRRVAYVAAGTLTGHTLVLDGGEPTPTIARASAGRSPKPTYSGDVTIDVKRTNRHARADKGTTKTYTLDHGRVLLGLEDQNGDGVVDLGDVLPGSRAKVIGKITKLPPRCDKTGFEPQLTIQKLIVHAPAPQPAS